MDIRQLRYLVGVIETKSLTRASETLRIAQPALGLQIRKLEDQLGVQLLLRHSRGVEPTQTGLLLYEEAKDLLSRLDQTVARIQGLSAVPQGRVSVGTTQSVNAVLASKIIQKSVKDNPLVSLSLVEQLSQTLLEMMEADRLDISFAHHERLSPALTFEPLALEELLFVQAPDPELSTEPISLCEISGHKLILPSAPHALRMLIEEKAERRGLVLDVPYEVHSWSTICELVEKGLGESVLPFSLIQGHVASGKLLARSIVEPRIVRTLHLVTCRNRPMTYAEMAVCETIRETVAAEIDEFPHIWKSVKAY